jgi:hypothetical protein
MMRRESRMRYSPGISCEWLFRTIGSAMDTITSLPTWSCVRICLRAGAQTERRT